MANPERKNRDNDQIVLTPLNYTLLMDGERIIARGKREAIPRKRALSALFGDTTAAVFG